MNVCVINKNSLSVKEQNKIKAIINKEGFTIYHHIQSSDGGFSEVRNFSILNPRSNQLTDLSEIEIWIIAFDGLNSTHHLMKILKNSRNFNKILLYPKSKWEDLIVWLKSGFQNQNPDDSELLNRLKLTNDLTELEDLANRR